MTFRLQVPLMLPIADCPALPKNCTCSMYFEHGCHCCCCCLQVAGSVLGPFGLEAMLSRHQKESKWSTYHLAAGMCVVMGISSMLLVPLSRCIPAVVCLLFAFGLTQAATETLVYIHVADRLEHIGKHVATHVSMAMYMIALAAGAGVGNMAGGALQQRSWNVQVAVAGVLAGTTGVYGAVLNVIGQRWAAADVQHKG